MARSLFYVNLPRLYLLHTLKNTEMLYSGHSYPGDFKLCPSYLTCTNRPKFRTFGTIPASPDKLDTPRPTHGLSGGTGRLYSGTHGRTTVECRIIRGQTNAVKCTNTGSRKNSQTTNATHTHTHTHSYSSEVRVQVALCHGWKTLFSN